MSLDLDRSSWTRVKFGDVVSRVSDTGLPSADDCRTYVGLEHMPMDGSLTVTSWGSEVDIVVPKTRVKAGDVLFARRNTQLRRVAIAPHDGYFSPDGYALRPATQAILMTFLPWIVASKGFMDFAVQHSAGTHSKRVKWSDLAKYEFDLPPIEDQKRIADLLWAMDRHRSSLAAEGATVRRTLSHCLWGVLGQDQVGSMTSIGALARVRHGFAFDGAYFSDDPELPTLVTPANFRIGGGFQEAATKSFAGPVDPRYVLDSGDLIVTMTDLSKAGDTLGYSAIVPKGKEYLHNQRIGLVEIQPGAQVRAQYLGWIMRSTPYRRHILSTATGSTVRHTSPSRVEAFEFLLPTLDEQASALRILEGFDLAEERVDREMALLGDCQVSLLRAVWGSTDVQ